MTKASSTAGEILGASTFPVSLALKLMTVLLSAQTFLVEGTKLSALPTERRDSWMHRWETSRMPPMRQYMGAIRAIALTVYYASPTDR